MNNVILVGRLTRDPELRTTPNGIATCQISLAINGVPNANGERTTDFINVTVWRRQAENVAKYCTKGSQVGVTGRIHSRSYDAQDGSKRYVTEVVADNVQFLDSRSSGNNGGNDKFDFDSISPSDFSSSMPTTEVKNDPFADFGASIEINDDELPF